MNKNRYWPSHRAFATLVGKHLIIAALLGAFASVASPAHAADAVRTFNIPAQSAATGLNEFARQADITLAFSYELVSGERTNAVQGDLLILDALARLLKGTKLGYKRVSDKTIAIDAASASALRSEQPPLGSVNAQNGPSGQPRLAQVDQGKASSDSSVKKEEEEQASKKKPVQLEEMRVTLPEVLVIGSKSLNMDIKRSRDDAQPYVVFDRDTIERSGAADLNDFLRQRLTQNTQPVYSNQTPSTLGTLGLGSQSQINLRGFGTNQTLILIDGHRAASPVTAIDVEQSDISGIPLAAVERIEVLSTTASGIYGGSATGGVVNVVLRHDYTGADLKLSYESPFDTHVASRSFDASGGLSLEDGKTNVMAGVHYSDGDRLLNKERDFFQRGQAAILANNPSFFVNSFIPPMGSTTNIRSADGSPLFGPGTPSSTFVPVGYGGGGGIAPFQANAGKYNLEQPDNASSFGGGKETVLWNAPTVKSLTATVRRQFTPNLQLFLDLGASNTLTNFPVSNEQGFYFIGAGAPNNPFGKDLFVTVPVGFTTTTNRTENDTRRVVGGFILQLPLQWKAEGDYTWDYYRLAVTGAGGLSGAEAGPISTGALDVLRDTNAFPVDFSPYFVTTKEHDSPFRTTLGDATLRLSGPVGSLPAGAPTLLVLVEHRDERFSGGEQNFEVPPPPLTLVYPNRSQSVDSLYVEAKVPLISARSRIPGIEEMELQLAGRRDDYTVHGVSTAVVQGSAVSQATNKLHSTNPTIGLRLRPIQDLLLRASYNTGFLPPSVQQLVPNPPFPLSGLATDPRRGNETLGAYNLLTGGNPNLRPENSIGWSTGVILTPHFVPGLRLSVDYTRISKTDDIFAGFTLQQVVDNEALLPGAITRGPVPPNDPFGVGPIVAINESLRNIARAMVSAYDTALDFHQDTAHWGAFDFFATATWEMHFKTQVITSSPVVENVGISNANPLKFKANAGLTWSFHRWTLGWVTRYFDSYLVADPSVSPDQILSQGNGGRVPSQIYHDLYARYAFGRGAGASAGRIWGGMEMQLGIKNVLNSEPPVDVSSSPFSPYSPFCDVRLRDYWLSLKKSF